MAAQVERAGVVPGIASLQALEGEISSPVGVQCRWLCAEGFNGLQSLLHRRLKSELDRRR